MTTWVHNPAYLGLANGTALTNGSSTDAAAGAVLGAVTSTGGGITYQSGTWQCLGNAGAARLDLTTGTAARIAYEPLFEVVAVPTGAENRCVEFMGSSGFSLRVTQLTTGQFRLFNSNNTSLLTTTNSYSAGTRVRMFVASEPGSSATTGKLRWAVYSGSNGLSTTPDETMYSVDNGNAGTSITIPTVRVGRITSTAGSAATIKLINLQAKDTDLNPIGPLIATSKVFYSINGTTLIPAVLRYSVDGSTTTLIV